MNLAHPDGERDTAAALGIPHDRYTQAGMFPVGYTVGTEFKPVPTPPLDQVVHWVRW